MKCVVCRLDTESLESTYDGSSLGRGGSSLSLEVIRWNVLISAYLIHRVVLWGIHCLYSIHAAGSGRSKVVVHIANDHLLEMSPVDHRSQLGISICTPITALVSIDDLKLDGKST